MAEVICSDIEAIRQCHQSGDIRRALSELKRINQTRGLSPSASALMSVLLIQNGEGSASPPFLSMAQSSPPEESAGQSDLGLALFLVGKTDEALTILTAASEKPDADAILFNRLGAVYQSRHQHTKALSAFLSATRLNPVHPVILHNLGVSYMRIEQYENARRYFEEALKIEPGRLRTQELLLHVLAAQERIEDRIDGLSEKLRQNPTGPADTMHELAGLYAATGDISSSLKFRVLAARSDPENALRHLNLGHALFEQGQYLKTIGVLNTAKTKFPDHPGILSLLSRSHAELGQHANALRIISHAASACPDDASVLLSRAAIYIEAGKWGEAENDLSHVTRQFPGNDAAWLMYGQFSIQMGRLDDAIVQLSRATRLNPMLSWNLAEVLGKKCPDALISHLTSVAENKAHPPLTRSAVYFAMTRIYDQQHKFKAAFQSADEANRLTKNASRYQGDAVSRFTNRIISIFHKERVLTPSGGHPGDQPIFIVGMPRSGTTLLEQMLSKHPDIFDCGECAHMPQITRLFPKVLESDLPYPECVRHITPQTAYQAGAYYLSQIDPAARTSQFFTDKLPHNFMNIGLIKMILPSARIIHIKRDMRDVALSSYFTNFRYRHGMMGYANDLVNIARHSNDHDRIMAHWHEILGDKLYTVQYADLVTRPEETLGSLFKYLKIPWDNAVCDHTSEHRPVKTASVLQVREPVHTRSKGKWVHYEKELAPFLSRYGSPSPSTGSKI